MAVTAHPLATRAALDMLRRGGSAADAAIAAQMVIGLVEAQSSGLGGGTLAMYWDAAGRKLTAWDGLARAPAKVTPGLRVDVDGTQLDADLVSRGGRSVGVPGTLPLMKQLHERHGKLPWARLFDPAIAMAEQGFAMAPYMHGILAARGAAETHPELRGTFLNADGSLPPVGTILRNPAYGATLRRIAAGGAEALYAGGHGEEFLAAVKRGGKPGLIEESDLRSYRVAERAPLCAPFLAYSVCVMAPPSFGGVYVLQVLQMLEARAGGRFDFADPAFAHLYLEAGKLAQADRRRYVGDPDFFAVPAREMIDPGYLRARAAAIDLTRAEADPKPGTPAPGLAGLTDDESEHFAATSQIAVVDRRGNALSITTTINLNFGSRLAAGGYVLNNAMTNFAPAPRGNAVAVNRMEPNKRPVSSMAPTMAFDRSGRPVVVGGSAGGGPIVDYIAQSLVEMLANDRAPAEALAQGHLSTATAGKIQLERGSAAAALAGPLRARGHEVEEATLLSGLGFLKRAAQGWQGAADPRRDGAALALTSN
ncbi:MAG: gamma-glutamyltransferase family protein [Alphaproteobacteria bacterium]|nr:gamma-glutamyltransferase family protein [Alphaproteobacteria bacterium]